MRCLQAAEEKKGPSSIKGKAEVRMGFFLAPVGLVFLAILLYSRYTSACIHIQIYAEHNHTWYTNFNERTNTLLYKKISLTLYFRKGWCFCVWEMSWRRGQATILTPSSSSTIAAVLSHLDWLAQPWVTEGPKPSVCKLFSRWHPVSNWLEPPRAPVYNSLTSTCFRCSSACLHRCISWLTTRSRVNI